MLLQEGKDFDQYFIANLKKDDEMIEIRTLLNLNGGACREGESKWRRGTPEN